MIYTERELEMYREGLNDGLLWVLDHVELTDEDEDRIQEVLDA